MTDVTSAGLPPQPVAAHGWWDRDLVRVYPALLASGFAALTYEVLWVRLLGELFGHTIYAVQTVLAVFFLGLAAGAWITASVGRFIRHPARAFAIVELALGAFAILLPAILRFVTPLYDRFAPLETETPAATAARLFVTICVLIIPTALMGATFPLAVALAGPSRVATVYAVNTLGGAIAVWMTVAVALPAYGVRSTLAGAAVCNLLAAALMAAVRGRDRALPVAEPLERSTWLDERSAAVLLFGTGMTALALEFLWTRALEQILSGTIFTFAWSRDESRTRSTRPSLPPKSA